MVCVWAHSRECGGRRKRGPAASEEEEEDEEEEEVEEEKGWRKGKGLKPQRPPDVHTGTEGDGVHSGVAPASLGHTCKLARLNVESRRLQPISPSLSAPHTHLHYPPSLFHIHSPLYKCLSVCLYLSFARLAHIVQLTLALPYPYLDSRFYSFFFLFFFLSYLVHIHGGVLQLTIYNLHT